MEQLTREDVKKIMPIILQPVIQRFNPPGIRKEIYERVLDLRNTAENEEHYLALMTANVAFLSEIHLGFEMLLETMLDKQVISTQTSLENMIYESQFVIKERLEEVREKYILHFAVFKDKEERKKQLELAYCPLLLSQNIKHDFLMEFIHPKNRTVSKSLLAADTKDVMDALHYYCNFYADMFLEGFTIDSYQA